MLCDECSESSVIVNEFIESDRKEKKREDARFFPMPECGNSALDRNLRKF